MFKNPTGERVSKRVENIDRNYIAHQKRIAEKAPIKGSGKLDLEDMPQGVQLFGPLRFKEDVGAGRKKGGKLMSGFSQNADFQNGYEESRGAKGSGKSSLSNKDLWAEIEKAIDKKEGGNVVDSIGNDYEDMDEMMRGGEMYSEPSISEILNVNPSVSRTVATLARNSDLLAPILERAPENTKDKAKYILENMASIVKDVAPIVRLILELKRGSGKRGGASNPGPEKKRPVGPFVDFTGGKKKKMEEYDSDSEMNSESDEMEGGKKRAKAKPKRQKTAWNLFVQKMMKKMGGSMKETLKHIKENNLWKK